MNCTNYCFETCYSPTGAGFVGGKVGAGGGASETVDDVKIKKKNCFLVTYSADQFETDRPPYSLVFAVSNRDKTAQT